MRFTSALVVALLFTVLGSCAASSVQVVPMPPQNVAVSSPDLCRVYILRDSELRGSLASVRVYDADTEIGTIEEDDYLCWERAPGRTLVRLYYTGVANGAGDKEGLLDLRTEAGQRYVYLIGLSYPDRQPDPELVSGKDAQELLAARKPAPQQK